METGITGGPVLNQEIMVCTTIYLELETAEELLGICYFLQKSLVLQNTEISDCHLLSQMYSHCDV